MGINYNKIPASNKKWGGIMCLYLSLNERAVGTAYMIWTGIGGVGTVVLGIVFFHDAVTFWRMFFLSLVFVGIVGLKMVH